MVIIVKVEVSTGKKKIIIIIIKEFIIRIYILKLNLFKLVACVSYHRVYRRELKLIAACLTIL